MTPATIQAAADALLQHRQASARPGEPITHAPLQPASRVLGPDLAPQSAQDAYAIQDAHIPQLGPIAGWKVGAKGTGTPTCAPLWQAHCHDAAQAPVFSSDAVDYECEIAYVFGQPLPARAGRPYTLDEITAAIASTHVGMELLAPRFAPPDTTTNEPFIVLADGQVFGAYILGSPQPGYRRIDCAAQRIAVDVSGQRVIDHAGGIPVPALEPLLLWLANHLAERGQPIKAGDVVTTGSWMGKRAAEVGEVAVRFEGVGEMRVRFAERSSRA